MEYVALRKVNIFPSASVRVENTANRSQVSYFSVAPQVYLSPRF